MHSDNRKLTLVSSKTTQFTSPIYFSTSQTNIALYFPPVFQHYLSYNRSFFFFPFFRFESNFSPHWLRGCGFDASLQGADTANKEKITKLKSDQSKMIWIISFLSITGKRNFLQKSQINIFRNHIEIYQIEGCYTYISVL